MPESGIVGVGRERSNQCATSSLKKKWLPSRDKSKNSKGKEKILWSIGALTCFGEINQML